MQWLLEAPQGLLWTVLGSLFGALWGRLRAVFGCKGRLRVLFGWILDVVRVPFVWARFVMAHFRAYSCDNLLFVLLFLLRGRRRAAGAAFGFFFKTVRVELVLHAGGAAQPTPRGGRCVAVFFQALCVELVVFSFLLRTHSAHAAGFPSKNGTLRVPFWPAFFGEHFFEQFGQPDNSEGKSVREHAASGLFNLIGEIHSFEKLPIGICIVQIMTTPRNVSYASAVKNLSARVARAVVLVYIYI